MCQYETKVELGKPRSWSFFDAVRKFLVIKGFLKHVRMKNSDIKSERHFDDYTSSLSNSKYMREKIRYEMIHNKLLTSRLLS